MPCLVRAGTLHVLFVLEVHLVLDGLPKVVEQPRHVAHALLVLLLVLVHSDVDDLELRDVLVDGLVKINWSCEILILSEGVKRLTGWHHSAPK